ncbi:MAG: FAD binding domain-containing protein, partial [Candidatus Cloacimonadaceae bacterium]|nr:FAD binding domain-containing protein [Candidatus Cloacimonadaceae bacterium]
KQGCLERRAVTRFPETVLPYKARYSYNRIKYWLNGTEITDDIPPGLTTLDYLHQTLGMYGTKCSCNEGDCGACTVVVCSAKAGKVCYEAINSCLYPAAKLHGKHLITIEGLGSKEQLHPIKQVMLDFHSTQCGYCTPGFVMSLFALLATHKNTGREAILAALEGNLCRCTGYDSILQAAEYLAAQYDIEGILPQWCRALEPMLSDKTEPECIIVKDSDRFYLNHEYYKPRRINEYFELYKKVKDKDYRIINGGTDIMVQININRSIYPILIDVSQLEDFGGIDYDGYNITIGAASTYSDVLHNGYVKKNLPALVSIIRSIASEQIRNFGTLAGNIGNASPIGDTLPLLLVYDAVLTLVSPLGKRKVKLRDFFLGYRKTGLSAGELIQSICIPVPPRNAYTHSIKATKRKSVDISAVCTAISLEFNKDKIDAAALALGGVAATPVLSKCFATIVLGKSMQELDVEAIASSVQAEFQPLSDVRGSKQYRSRLIHNHVVQYLQQATEQMRRKA